MDIKATTEYYVLCSVMFGSGLTHALMKPKAFPVDDHAHLVA
jgi:hypothetical protein